MILKKLPLDMCFGLVLFVVNAIFSLILYLEVASGVWYYVVAYSLLAVSFDTGMMLLWVRGVHDRNPVFIVVACGFAILSLFAAGSSSLSIVEAQNASNTVVASEVADLESEVASLEADLATNRDAIAKTPEDFTTRLRELNRISADLRASLEAKRLEVRTAKRIAASKTSTSTSMFDVVGKALRVAPKTVELCFLLGTSGMMIVGAFALTAPRKRAKAAPTLRTLTYGTTTHAVLASGRTLCGKPSGPAMSPPHSLCPVCFARLVQLKEVPDANA